MNGHELYELVAKDFAHRISDTFRELLQKHLYQSVSLEKAIEDLKAQIDAGAYTPPEHMAVDQIKKDKLLKQFETLSSSFWAPGGEAGFFVVSMTQSPANAVRFIPPSVKLYCPECGRSEPHNPIYDDCLPAAQHANSRPQSGTPMTIQWFGFGYECQSCKGVPVVFLVQRIGSKLTLTGRSPIEQVEMPKFIPKAHRNFYSSAIVAHQSGQTLAGIFLLRTFIEQTARATVKVSHSYKTGDELMEAYMATLHDVVRGEFPSMKKLYEELSADMHAATGSVPLFEDAMKRIENHFKAKQLFAER